MIAFMARYSPIPNQPNRLAVEMDDVLYQAACREWEVTPGTLRVSLTVGEKSVYISPKPDGYKLTKTSTRRWRVVLRSNTFRHINRLPKFGISECQAALDTERGNSLRIDLPEDPKPARPHHARKPYRKGSNRSSTPPATGSEDGDRIIEAAMVVGGTTFPTTLSVTELVDLVERGK